MKRTARLLSITIAFAISALTLFLAGCGSESISSKEDSSTGVAGLEPAAVEVSPTMEPVSTVAAAAVLTETLAVDTCFACHTDKERLIKTANPEEEVINENEGEG